MDSTSPDAVAGAFDSFLEEWRTQIGDGFPMPAFSAATVADFRVKARAVRVGDTAITDMRCASALQTDGSLGGTEDQVRMYVVHRGAWTLEDPAGRNEQTVAAGQILLRHVGRAGHFRTTPNTAAQVLVLPANLLRRLLGDRIITGPVDSAEVRLLAAHAGMVHATAAELGPAGRRAAQGTLVELARAVAMGRFDDTESRLAPALAQAAKDLAESLLTDPELSAPMLARRLNVSLRTLHRAFATTQESVTGYIRRRRLEEARLALAWPAGRPSVSEIAARWHFSDGSHLTRAFKKQYGQTPSDYARTITPNE